jgi:glutaredoxin-related protein
MNKQISKIENVSIYFINLLNISIEDELTMIDMLQELEVIEDLNSFRIFVKRRFNYEKFRFLTGYQKFISLSNEFRKENKLKLDAETQERVDNYSEMLFNKITRVIEEINFKLQELGKKIDDFDYLETLKKNGFVSSDIEILNTIGDKKRMFHLALYSKHELKERIERIVNKKTLIKVYPQLEIDKNFIDTENIEILKLLDK